MILSMAKEIRMNKFQNVVLPLYTINIGRNPKSALYPSGDFEITSKNIAPTEFSKTIKKCIELAIAHSEDFVVISTNNHQFSDSYSKDLLISNLITANKYG